jgi:hypothetical protein
MPIVQPKEALQYVSIYGRLYIDVHSAVQGGTITTVYITLYRCLYIQSIEQPKETLQHVSLVPYIDVSMYISTVQPKDTPQHMPIALYRRLYVYVHS